SVKRGSVAEAVHDVGVLAHANHAQPPRLADERGRAGGVTKLPLDADLLLLELGELLLARLRSLPGIEHVDQRIRSAGTDTEENPHQGDAADPATADAARPNAALHAPPRGAPGRCVGPRGHAFGFACRPRCPPTPRGTRRTGYCAYKGNLGTE